MKMKRFRLYEFDRVMTGLSYSEKKLGVKIMHDEIESARQDINKLEKAYPKSQFIIVDYSEKYNSRIIYVTQ